MEIPRLVGGRPEKPFDFQEFLEMKAQGKNNVVIAKEMGMSPSTLYRNLKVYRVSESTKKASE